LIECENNSQNTSTRNCLCGDKMLQPNNGVCSNNNIISICKNSILNNNICWCDSSIIYPNSGICINNQVVNLCPNYEISNGPC